MKMVVPCAGIIVFDGDKTILVSTHQGNFSFPKGKRNKNESDIETAWREFEEETGITKEHVELVDDFYLDETSAKGFPSVRYFVGKLVGQVNNFKFDTKELANVGWYSISDVMKIDKIKTARKKILEQAFQKISCV